MEHVWKMTENPSYLTSYFFYSYKVPKLTQNVYWILIFEISFTLLIFQGLFLAAVLVLIDCALSGSKEARRIDSFSQEADTTGMYSRTSFKIIDVIITISRHFVDVKFHLIGCQQNITKKDNNWSYIFVIQNQPTHKTSLEL